MSAGESSLAGEARLRHLVELGGSLSAARSPDEVIQAVLRAVVAIFDAEGGSVASLDPDNHELTFQYMEGDAKAVPFRLPSGRGIAGAVVASGEAILCNDVSADPRFFAGIDARTKFRTRALLCAPIRRRTGIIGCIQALNSRRPGGFQPADRDAMIALAGMAGHALERVRDEHALRRAHASLQEYVDERHPFLPSEQGPMRDAVETLRAAARSRSTVLLLGETGVGKEVAARALHGWSPRRGGPFIGVNCSALSPTLLESELFGHERGAFTGALQRRLGRFELAEGGTLFLDEIGDMPVELQTRLLRVLQERELERVGGSERVLLDVRVVAATHRDLPELVQAGRFREDLYHRLNVISVRLPPLRERRHDIAPLARLFLHRSSLAEGRAPLALSPEALASLESYAWPGNVRELANAMERLAVLCRGERVEVDDLAREMRAPPSLRASSPPPTAFDQPLAPALDAFKREYVRRALAECGGNQQQAARRLGLNPANLSRLLKSLGMRAPSPRGGAGSG